MGSWPVAGPAEALPERLVTRIVTHYPRERNIVYVCCRHGSQSFTHNPPSKTQKPRRSLTHHGKCPVDEYECGLDMEEQRTAYSTFDIGLATHLNVLGLVDNFLDLLSKRFQQNLQFLMIIEFPRNFGFLVAEVHRRKIFVCDPSSLT